MRPIDADNLKSVVCQNCELQLEGLCASYGEVAGCLAGEIDNAPTIDAVEVVRCADCRRFKYNLTPDGYLPEGVNETECMLFHCGMDYTDYCSFGERRTECGS